MSKATSSKAVEPKGDQMIRVSSAVHALAKEYSTITGVPLGRVFEDAMTDWLRTVGAARIEVRHHTTAKLEQLARENNVVQFPTQP